MRKFRYLMAGQVHAGGYVNDPKLILLFDILVAGLVVFNIQRMLKTGVARDFLANIATREAQPARYWRHVYASYAVLAFCAATFLWAIAFPESLR